MILRSLQFIQTELEAKNLPPRLLEVEITESDLMVDVNTSIGILAELDSLGVKITIDDFGTGYSSFSYLLQFPVSTLKIDKSFVNRMLERSNPSSRTVVKGIIAIAHSLRLSVVAEGVETEGQMKALQRMNCDVLQGFFFSKSLTLRDYVRYVYSKSTADCALDPYKT